MVLYALAAGRISIAALFLAGYIPGLLVGLGLMIVAYIISRRRNYPKRTEKIPLKVMITVVKNSVLALLMPVIIIGGILSGAFTATEAAAVAVAYAFIVCFFVFRSLKFSELPAIFMNTAKISAVVFLLCATTNILSWILTLENVPQTLLGFFTSISSSPLMFLLFTNVILLFIGTFIDTVPAIFIMVPILKPVADMLGIHPLHFGVVVTLNLLIGLNTPPVGTCIFVASSIARISLEELVREIWPFLVVQIAVLLLITYIPDLVLFIPRLFGFA
jgi:tripartite ATP-independent transporter DctM subunit